MEELVRMRVRRPDARAAPHADVDPDRRVGAAVALDVLQHELRAERLGRVAHVEVGRVGAVLQHVAAAELEDLVVVVDRPLREGDLLGRLDHAHPHRDVTGVTEGCHLERVAELRELALGRVPVEPDALGTEAPTVEAAEHPEPEVHRAARAGHGAGPGISIVLGLREVEVVLDVPDPPAPGEVAVEARDEE